MSKGKSRRQGSKQFLACLQTNGKYESQRGHSPHPAAGTGVGSACSVQPACRSQGPTTEAAAWKELQPRHSYLCYSDPPIWKENKQPKEVLSRCSCWNEQNQAGVRWSSPFPCTYPWITPASYINKHSCLPLLTVAPQNLSLPDSREKVRKPLVWADCQQRRSPGDSRQGRKGCQNHIRNGKPNPDLLSVWQRPKH